MRDQYEGPRATAPDKQSMDNEFDQLRQEIDDIAGKTAFNGNKLLNGTVPSISLHTGDGATDTLTVNLYNASSTAIGIEDPTTPGTVTAGSALSDAHLADDPTGGGAYTGNPQAAISIIDGAVDWVSKMRASLGATQNRLGFASDNLSSSSINLSAEVGS